MRRYEQQTERDYILSDDLGHPAYLNGAFLKSYIKPSNVVTDLCCGFVCFVERFFTNKKIDILSGTNEPVRGYSKTAAECKRDIAFMESCDERSEFLDKW